MCKAFDFIKCKTLHVQNMFMLNQKLLDRLRPLFLPVRENSYINEEKRFFFPGSRN